MQKSRHFAENEEQNSRVGRRGVSICLAPSDNLDILMNIRESSVPDKYKRIERASSWGRLTDSTVKSNELRNGNQFG